MADCACVSSGWDDDDDFGTFVSAPHIPHSATSPSSLGGSMCGEDLPTLPTEGRNKSCKNLSELDHKTGVPCTVCLGQVCKHSHLSRFKTSLDAEGKSLADFKVVGLDNFSAFHKDSSSWREGVPHIGNLFLQHRNCSGSDLSSECLDKDRSTVERKGDSPVVDSGVFSSDLSPVLASDSWSSFDTDRAGQCNDNCPCEYSQGGHQAPLVPLQQDTAETVIQGEGVRICCSSQIGCVQEQNIVSHSEHCGRDIAALGDRNTAFSNSEDGEIWHKSQYSTNKDSSDQWATFKTDVSVCDASISQGTQNDEWRQQSDCHGGFTVNKGTLNCQPTCSKACSESKSGCDDEIKSGTDSSQGGSGGDADCIRCATAQHNASTLSEQMNCAHASFQTGLQNCQFSQSGSERNDGLTLNDPAVSVQSTQEQFLCLHTDHDWSEESTGFQTDDYLNQDQYIPVGNRSSCDFSVIGECIGSSNTHIHNQVILSKEDTCSGDTLFMNIAASGGDDDFGHFSSSAVTASSDGDCVDFGDFSAPPLYWEAKAQSSSSKHSAISCGACPTYPAGDDADCESPSRHQYHRSACEEFSEQAGNVSWALDSDWASFAASASASKAAENSGGLPCMESADAHCHRLEDSASTNAEKVRWNTFDKPLMECFLGSSAPVSFWCESGTHGDNTERDVKTSDSADALRGLLEVTLEMVLKSQGHSLQVQPQTGQQPDRKYAAVWSGLCDVDSSGAVRYQWSRSSSRSHLLQTLRINTDSMLTELKKPSVPNYTTGLSLLDSPSKTSRERRGADGGGGRPASGSAGIATSGEQFHHICLNRKQLDGKDTFGSYV